MDGREWLEAFPTAALVVDADGRVAMANALALEAFPVTVGEPVDAAFPIGDRAPMRAAVSQALDPAAPERMTALQLGASTFEVRPIGPHVLLSLRECAREVELAALRESHERFTQLVSHIHEVFWLTGTDKNEMLYLSPGYEVIWGRTVASVFERPISWVEAIHPDDRERVLEAARTKQAAGTYDEVYRIVRPDGEERWIRDRAFPIPDHTGRITRVAGVAEDVTLLRTAEEQVRGAQRLDAMGRLAAGVAHDFNNVLSVVLSSAELAIEQLDDGSPVREDLEQIEEAGKHAASLTRQLLAFSRHQVLQPRALDLGTVLRGLERMLRRLVREDVVVQVRLSSDELLVHADVTQIEQMIVNLVLNARDAIPAAGTIIVTAQRVSLSPPTCERFGVPPGAYVEVTVSDNGLGMDSRTLTQIFEPFFTTKPRGKGTGLGLATVFGIVKQSQGGLSVWSQPGRGSTFTLVLPELQGALVEETDVLLASVRDHVGQGQVLLVEDEVSVRRVARGILTRLGYDVIEAAHPMEALALEAQHPGTIDLLVTDMVMPYMGGPELAQRLLRARPDMRVLFMSGYAEDASFDIERFAGAGFLQKPLSVTSLARKVREVLHGAAS
ncbi:MAG: PAS domain-containing protein [Polyangiaceae bacterium]